MDELQIVSSGALSTLQDCGRRGYLHLGLSVGGAADLHAYLWAQRLLRNRPAAGAIEITLGQFRARFNADTTIAITGADADLFINGQRSCLWREVAIKQGDEIHLVRPRSGLLNYLAVAEGFQVERVFGSLASVPREGSGHAPLKNGDTLHYTPVNRNATRIAPEKYIPDYSQILTLRLIPGMQYHYFSATEVANFLATELTVDSNSNRMAYRLNGMALECDNTALASEGIPYGAVQIPPSGQAFVLLSDRQSLGGYPKLGCIAKQDCWRLSQKRPGEKVKFVRAELAQCQSELASTLAFFRSEANA